MAKITRPAMTPRRVPSSRAKSKVVSRMTAWIRFVSDLGIRVGGMMNDFMMVESEI